MIYAFDVAHADDAVPRLELALHRRSQDEIEEEYEQVDTPFSIYFSEKPAVKASYEVLPGRQGLRITLDGPTSQSEADEYLRGFLVWWNNMSKGLAVVLVRRHPPR